MPSLQGGSDSLAMKQSLGIRRSERPKNPYSHFNEDAKYVAEPPRLVKKKVSRGDPGKGTTLKSLLLSNWSDAQIARYCDACGISFTDSASECFNHLRLLEQSQMPLSRESLATSSEGRVA